jgi:hypothetical protein
MSLSSSSRGRRWRGALTVIAAGALALVSVPASADNITQSIGANGTTTISLSGGSAQTTVNYFLDNNGNSACSASSSVHVIYDINIGAPGGVTASPNKLDLTSCNVNIPVTFTTTTTGSRLVTLTEDAASGARVNPNNASFTLVVSGSTNTAPHVSVGGVTGSASYEFGSVPAASCTVTDAEDSNPSATPVLSAITGPLSGYGLGSQTATCSYTDAGNLTATASATYSIVDTHAPALDTPGDQTVEATSSAGGEASWTGPTATDAVHVQSVGCDVTSPHTFPLGDTVVHCSATDEAGNQATGSFTITVVDTTKPTLTVSSDVTKEATGPGGASVDYDAPTATDNYDSVLTPTCSPASGSLFALGNTSVSCSVTDSSNNTSTGGFTVHVVDTTAPDVTVPADMTVEADSPQGANVDFDVTALDIVDGATSVSCDHQSGDTFDFGTTVVSCASTDNAGNTGHGSFSILVQDTTPPVLDSHGDVTAEATGPNGAAVTYTKPGATDAASTTVTVDCILPSGSTFALGSTPVNCTATDAHGNTAGGSFNVIVQDTTAPTLTLPADQTAEATGPSGATVTFSATASDLVDGATTVTCSPVSGSTFALGNTTVNCTSTDLAGNTAAGSFTVHVVDTTAPTLHLPSNMTLTATSAAGAPASWTATATDAVDTSVDVTCVPPSGSTFAPGTTTVNCSATDDSGNQATGSFTVTVNFGWNGFFAPVDNGILNTIKGGQSVPLKWSIPNGSGGWISSLSVVKSVMQASITCANTLPTDDIETPTSGATSLRYDTTANQYIYNWQSPKAAGNCYRITVTLTDNSTHVALFKTK